MAVLQNKIDFALVIAVNHANPNGDPLNGNRPRETYEGLGEISDVCLKDPQPHDGPWPECVCPVGRPLQ